MKHIVYFFFISFLIANHLFSQDVWINEFSYDCIDSPTGPEDGDEFIEIVAPVGTDMSQYGVIFFNLPPDGDYIANTYAQLSGTISATNSDDGKGFFVIKTNFSHQLENYSPIPNGITSRTIESEMCLTNDEGGILLIYHETGEVIHGVFYELPVGIEIPEDLINTLDIEVPWAKQNFKLGTSDIDGIRLPLVDSENSTPGRSISMIGTGYSRIWPTGNNSRANIGTPGAINYSQSALPVELSSFSAVVTKNEVKLNWITETEVNNYGFEVERSVVLNEVRNLSWEKIGFVNGDGNSNSPKSYSYVDKHLIAGKYLYRLKQIDNDGQFEYSETIKIDLGTPEKLELSQNYPNPFNPTTTISWQSPISSWQTLKVYDLLGNEVSTLFNEYREAGKYEIDFNASELSSGLYIYKLHAGNFIQSRKMILLK